MAENEDEAAAEQGDLEDIKHQLEESLGKEEIKKELLQRHISQDGRRQSSTAAVKRRQSTTTSHNEDLPLKDAVINNKDKDKNTTSKAGVKLIEKETAAVGGVEWTVYYYYLQNIGLLGKYKHALVPD